MDKKDYYEELLESGNKQKISNFKKGESSVWEDSPFLLRNESKKFIDAFQIFGGLRDAQYHIFI